MPRFYIPSENTALGNSIRFCSGRESVLASAASLDPAIVAPFNISALRGKHLKADKIPTGVSAIVSPPTSIGTRVGSITSDTGFAIVGVGNGILQAVPNSGVFIKRSAGGTELGRGSVAEFKFITTNLFKPSIATHMGVILRGYSNGMSSTSPGLSIEGNGVVIGNVSGYTSPLTGCGPNPLKYDVTVENFWDVSNCVVGANSIGHNLQDGVVYTIRIAVDDIDKTVSVWILGAGGQDYSVVVPSVYYTMADANPSNSHDMFMIGCASDGRDWSFEYGDVVYYNYK